MLNRVSKPLLMAAVIACPTGHATEERISEPSAEETVTISAREAWEDEAPDVINFRGDFQLETTQWQIRSEEATLYGNLDDPDTVILDGTPAVFIIEVHDDESPYRVEGKATRIIYEKALDSIFLQGDASISNGDSLLEGGSIRYYIGNDEISATGEAGVRIRAELNG